MDLVSEPKPRAKLAEVTAKEIEKRIIAGGWPVGEVLGSEADLISEYGISRAVFREAVRLLERDHIGFMQRGRNGGLVVIAPEAESVANASALYLEYHRVEPKHLIAARTPLELESVGVAAATIDEDGIAELRRLLDEEAQGFDAFNSAQHNQLHFAIARIAGNPAVELFIRVLLSLSTRRADDNTRPDRAKTNQTVHHAHAMIVDAIISGDVALARHRMSRHLDAIGPWLT